MRCLTPSYLLLIGYANDSANHPPSRPTRALSWRTCFFIYYSGTILCFSQDLRPVSDFVTPPLRLGTILYADPFAVYMWNRRILPDAVSWINEREAKLGLDISRYRILN